MVSQLQIQSVLLSMDSFVERWLSMQLKLTKNRKTNALSLIAGNADLVISFRFVSVSSFISLFSTVLQLQHGKWNIFTCCSCFDFCGWLHQKFHDQEILRNAQRLVKIKQMVLSKLPSSKKWHPLLRKVPVYSKLNPTTSTSQVISQHSN
jgi:hypothetical protein